MMTLPRRIHRSFGLALLVGGLLLLVLALVSRADAVPGTADHDFGVAGDVMTDIGGSDLAYGVAVDPDGGIVIVGTSDARGSKFNLLLLRYDALGQPAADFGEGGISLTDLGGTDVGYAAAVQPDGRILVAGASDRGDERSLVLLRFTADGRLDPSFGIDGVVRLAVGTDYPMTMAVATQPDGAIVLAAHLPEGDGYLLQLMRFLPDGNIDTSFAVRGVAMLPFRGADGALALTLGPDGALFVAGSGRGDGMVVLTVARYTAEGGLEPWPPQGVDLLQVGLGGHRGTALRWMEDGTLVVAAYFIDGERHSLFLAQAVPDGEWEVLADATSGFDPTVTEILEEPYALAAQPDGRLVVAGSTSGDVALRRYIGMLGTAAPTTSTGTPTVAPTPRTPRPTVVRTPGTVITRTPAPPATTSPATATPTSSPPTATASPGGGTATPVATMPATPAPTATMLPTLPPTVPPTSAPTLPPPPPTPSVTPAATPPITATPATPGLTPTQPPAPSPRVPTATPIPTLPPLLPTLPPLPTLLPILTGGQ
jgi:uncharacterized delta-60 repeat protein